MLVSVLSVKAEELSNFYFSNVCMDVRVCTSRGCRGVSVCGYMCVYVHVHVEGREELRV